MTSACLFYMKKLLFILLNLISFTVNAQNRNNVWTFGDSTGIDFNNSGNIQPINSASLSRGSCVSICDTNGQLQFYAHTMNHPLWSQGYTQLTAVHEANGNLMQSGDSIIGEGWAHELTIIPKPGSSNLYYLFSIGIVFNPKGFYYSTIDMNANGGLGAVVQKNIQLNSFRNADCVTAIQHGNGRDWWVISKYSDNSTTTNRFYLYLVTPDTISLSSIQDMSNALNGDLHHLCFNSTGSKLMQSNRAGFLCDYDFDRCTGIISNQSIIYPEQQSNFSRNIVDVAYSPDDTKLYISTSYYINIDTSYLIQYDLTAANIAASADTLHRISWPVQGGAVRLAPDGKIYYTCFYDWGFPGYPYPDTVHNVYNENLGVINYPDSLGAACNFQPFSFYLGGKRTYYGLPNNPNYSLGPLVGSGCDTLHVGVNSIDVNNHAQLFVYYQSDWQSLFVNASGIKGKSCVLKIVDMNGRMVYSSTKTTQPPYFTQDVDCSALAKGMYVVQLLTEKEVMSKKFVKE
jgi:hypothetical protein